MDISKRCSVVITQVFTTATQITDKFHSQLYYTPHKHSYSTALLITDNSSKMRNTVESVKKQKLANLDILY